MSLYGLINRNVNVSAYVTSKGRIITEQGIGKNLEESGRFHSDVTPETIEELKRKKKP